MSTAFTSILFIPWRCPRLFPFPFSFAGRKRGTQMQLFHNRSQSLVPRTRATIVQLCKDYGISEKEAPNHGPLSDSNYPTYVKSITGFYPCPVCGGPQGRVLTGEARTVEV